MTELIPCGGGGKEVGWNEVGKSGKMLARVLVSTYALPDGVRIRLKHRENCPNSGRDDDIFQFIEEANPRVVSEFNVVLRGILGIIGCVECGVDKSTSAGILFNHSQDSSFAPSTQMTESYVSVDSPSASAVSSWGNSTILDRLPSSERALYKNYKDDRSSDEDYGKRRKEKRVVDVAMTLEDGKNTEGNGIGNSRYAGVVEVPATATKKEEGKERGGPPKFQGLKLTKEEIESTPTEDTQITLPSTVSYERASVDEALLSAINEMECGQYVPGIEEEDESMKGIVGGESEGEEMGSTLSDHDKIRRLERLVSDLREENDVTNDRLEEIVESIKNGSLGCEKCKVSKGKALAAPIVPYVPQMKVVKVEKRDKGKAVERVSGGKQAGSVTPLDVPSYKSAVGNFLAEKPKKITYAGKAVEGNKEGFTVVVGKAERKKGTRKAEVKHDNVPPVKERHLKVRFTGKRGVRHILPEGVSTESVRSELNKTLKELNVEGYFSTANANRWGDIELTLARTRAIDIVNTGNAMTEALEGLGLKEFSFVRDTPKVMLYVAMVPLKKGGFGQDWSPEDWSGENAFDTLAADIENSNPGVFIRARPSWVGKLHVMKSRKQSTAGLKILCETNQTTREILGRKEPKILIGGRLRFCRVWRDSNSSILCDKCCNVGHSIAECKDEPVCRWCRKHHLSSEHKCLIVDCPAPKGAPCMHCRKVCFLCDDNSHYTGFRECSVLRDRTSVPRFGPATPIEGDNTSANGVNDRSRNRFKITDQERRKTPLCEQVLEAENQGERSRIPRTRRSASSPPANKSTEETEEKVPQLLK